MTHYDEISINVKYHLRDKDDHTKYAIVSIDATDETALYKCICKMIKACPGNFIRDIMQKAIMQTDLKEN